MGRQKFREGPFTDARMVSVSTPVLSSGYLEKTLFQVVVLALLSVAGVFTAFAQEAPRLEDQVLAVVDEDPILYSDVERAIGLGLVIPETDAEGQPTEQPEAFRRRVLERLIEERLRFHTVESFGFEILPEEVIDAEVAQFKARYESPEELDRTLEAVNLDIEGLRQLLARQLKVLTYIEERLGPRIFIRREDVQVYYQDVLVPEMTAAGSEVPPLDEVRESIRLVLREQRLNQEITDWTQELRSRANVELFLNTPDELPPVVEPR